MFPVYTAEKECPQQRRDIALAQNLSKRVRRAEPKVATAKPEVGITGPKVQSAPI